jgi:hypothetical protein
MRFLGRRPTTSTELDMAKSSALGRNLGRSTPCHSEIIVSPIRLEKALQALHGIGPWDPTYRSLEFGVMRRLSAIKP